MADKKQSALSHLDSQGKASMVDITEKGISDREAKAQAVVVMQPETLDLVVAGNMKKGDVLSTARIAGIQAAKKCSDLIPLCHPLALTSIQLEFDIDKAGSCIRITSTCRLNGRTGVEMEALTAASVAALTIYDMCKAVEKGITINDIKLLSKSGGKSGDYNAKS